MIRYFFLLIFCCILSVQGYCKTDSAMLKLVSTVDYNTAPANVADSEDDYQERIKSATGDDIRDQLNKYTKSKFLNSYEFIICLMILGFASIVLFFEYMLVIRNKIDSAQGVKIIVITIIIFATIFLIACGYGNDQIAPAIGLMGTIAGYMLGKNAKSTEKES